MHIYGFIRHAHFAFVHVELIHIRFSVPLLNVGTLYASFFSNNHLHVAVRTNPRTARDGCHDAT